MSTMSTARRNPTFLLAGLLGVLVLAVAAMYLYDHSRRQDIAHGVSIGGVQVGGLSATAAKAKLTRELAMRLDQPVTVRYGTHTWHISGQKVGLTIDVGSLVEQAVNASRQGSIFSRTFRGLFGGSVNRDIPLHAHYSHAAVREFADRVSAAVDHPAINASVQPNATGLSEVRGHSGVVVNSRLLRLRVERALTGASVLSSVRVPEHIVHPAVSTAQLAAKYPAYIVIDRGAFTLRFYDHLKLASTYPIAVGMQGLETTAGLYSIQWKQVDPPWYVPNSAWAGALAGKTIPPGPQDPLKARFMAFNGGAGIHGIDPSEYSTIGHDASHGCVRMRIPDVIALYSRTPVGTPVYVA
ncbi:MAG TPA: L,D-transpeptidase [Solirubrobacteraceae bacterium]|jgi:lipoprotein-anchoring transpeptidase ErfK/SrfK|nr:L,D-transpeptidase [Solirubrobacteraceae bacterium]